MERTYAIQRNVAHLFAATGLVVTVLNVINLTFVQGFSPADAFLHPGVLAIIVSTLVMIVSSFRDDAAFRILQIVLIFTNASIAILDTHDSFFGLGFYVIGIVLLERYGFLRSGTRGKAVLLLIGCFILVEYSARRVKPSSLLTGLDVIAYLVMFLVFLRTIYREEISGYLKRQKDLSVQIESLGPSSRIGQNVSGLVHNLRNDITLINNCIFLQRTGSPDGTNTRILEKAVSRLSEKVDRILYASRAPVSGEEGLINLRYLLESSLELFLLNHDFKRSVRLDIDLDPDVSVRAVVSDVSQLVENLIQNAWDAVRMAGRNGVIRISCGRENDGLAFIEIGDDGVGIRHCSDIGCESASCLHCDFFSVGRTSKPGGSGFGMVYVMDVLQRNGGDLRIDGREGRGTTVRLLLRDHSARAASNR